VRRVSPIGATPYLPALRLWPGCFVVAQLWAVTACADELCRFAGTSDYSGRLAVTTNTDTRDGKTTVDVAARFGGTPMPFVRIHYLTEEISTWTSGRMQSVAVNTRYILDGHVVRQGWDVFERGETGLTAHRIEGKSGAAFGRDHPAFFRHWDPATFAQPWLQDFWSAQPERRADLDLPAASVAPDLTSPLALVFYWSRWIPRGGEAAPVFLPGFKKDKRVEVMIATAGAGADDRRLLETSVDYPWLGTSQASTAKAWISTDGHLSQLAFDIRSQNRSASGVIRQLGCLETAAAPGDRGR
jgi:hypothetical protein